MKLRKKKQTQKVNGIKSRTHIHILVGFCTIVYEHFRPNGIQFSAFVVQHFIYILNRMASISP